MKEVFKKINTEEIEKFETLLKGTDIDYIREDQTRKFPGGLGVYETHQIIGFNESSKAIWDVVCNTGSHGAEKGLLEFWGDTDSETVGFLDADEAFRLVCEMAGI